jgi:hypothetical protein
MPSFLDNLPIKIAALVLGLLLWFHVATDKEYSFELKLPLTDVLLDSGLTLSQFPPDSLRVVVRASGKLLLRNRWRRDGLRINATQFSAGRHQLNLSPANTSLPSASSFLTLDEVVLPSTIQLNIDSRTERLVPVQLNIDPIPDDGFAVRTISAPVPDEVMVTGPRKIITGLQTILTERMNISGLRNDLSLNLKLLKPTGYRITLVPDSVSAEIEIVPVKTRVFSGVPIMIFNSPPDQNVRLEPATVDVTVTGPPDQIDNLPGTSIVAGIDYHQITIENRAAIKADCSPNITVKSLSVDSVTVIVE